MSAEEKAQVLETVEASPGSKRKVLAELGVSKSDCYRWRARHGQGSQGSRPILESPESSGGVNGSRSGP